MESRWDAGIGLNLEVTNRPGAEQYLPMTTRLTALVRRRAFTLIELLVVIAIIAILAAMLLPALSRM